MPPEIVSSEGTCFLTAPVLLPYAARVANLWQGWPLQSTSKREHWRSFNGRCCWAGLGTLNHPCEITLLPLSPDMARVVNWELKLQILPLRRWTSPVSFTIISCQHKQGLPAVVPTLTSPSVCLCCTALFPPLLHPRCSHLPKVNKTWTWTKLNLFSTPFILLFNHVYCFIPFTKWICLHKCCCLHREEDSSSKGMRGCVLSRSKGRGSSILVAAAACAVLVIVKVQQSHNSHHYVCMANLHPANLYL